MRNPLPNDERQVNEAEPLAGLPPHRPDVTRGIFLRWARLAALAQVVYRWLSAGETVVAVAGGASERRLVLAKLSGEVHPTAGAYGCGPGPGDLRRGFCQLASATYFFSPAMPW